MRKCSGSLQGGCHPNARVEPAVCHCMCIPVTWENIDTWRAEFTLHGSLYSAL